MYRLLALLTPWFASALHASGLPGWHRVASHHLSAEMRAAALVADGHLYTWGDGLYRWTIANMTPELLTRGHFGPGGCLVDLDSDGNEEFVTTETDGLSNLVRRKAPTWTRELIDTQVEMRDCLGASLFGRQGLLTIHRFSQVRFYEDPRGTEKQWPVREIYSIYTPSQQGGLALFDVDGDGLVDIYCGNYWLKSPAAFELPWRLFAINTYSELPGSATLRLAPAGRDLAVAQSNVMPAWITYFTRPEDPKQLWIDHRLTDRAIRANALAVYDWNGDGHPDVLAGERNGSASRLLMFWGQAGGKFTAESARADGDVIGLFTLLDGKVVQVGRHRVDLWAYRRK